MIVDTDSESEEDSHVVIRQISEESSSEDEIQKIKVCPKSKKIFNTHKNPTKLSLKIISYGSFITIKF